MKHLLIIGARGFGREVYNYALASIGYGTEFDVKGFLDDKSDVLDGFDGYPAIIGAVETYEPQVDDVFICALGDVKWKKHYAQIILEKGGEFISLVSKEALVGRNCKMGKGCIISPTARMNCDVEIGDFVTLQPWTILGHDVRVGNWCHINVFADCGGGCQVEDEVAIHTHTFILPKLRVGHNSTIGAGSIVLRSVKPNVTMFGNPAKVVPLPNVNN